MKKQLHKTFFPFKQINLPKKFLLHSLNAAKYLLLPLVITPCFSSPPSEGKLKTLYNSLTPSSISQHLAFYELYGNYPLGRQALNDSWKLLMGVSSSSRPLPSGSIPLSTEAIQALLSLVNKPMDQEVILPDQETVDAMITISQRLPHTNLQGHQAWSEEEVLALPIEEIDLARGLFISQFGQNRLQIQSYEALIDLMALQILARLPRGAGPKEKIIAINAFIFEEMGFRFPPHSLYTKDIDLYSFLPSVLDSRRGVCLGVSILYMCLAQRLSLSLEMITPPGHIYVRYHAGDEIINIETTARGIHLDSEEYLSINTRSLQLRNIREAIGMVHFNHASLYWQNSEYAKVLEAYRKAEPYMRDDPLLKELMGYSLLLSGNREGGEKLLQETRDHVPDFALIKNTMAEDYLEGRVDPQGIGLIFGKVDEDRKSILAKKENLEKLVERYPAFRSGVLNLAVIWLQLHRSSEALEKLHDFLKLDRSDPEVHYYLSALYAQRFDYPQAWHHLQEAEAIVSSYGYSPKPLKELRRSLINCCPESFD